MTNMKTSIMNKKDNIEIFWREEVGSIYQAL